MVTDVHELDEVELKRPHPCLNHSKRFQIIRLGGDVKIRCLGCGAYLLLHRDNFNKRIKKVISSHDDLIEPLFDVTARHK